MVVVKYEFSEILIASIIVVAIVTAILLLWEIVGRIQNKKNRPIKRKLEARLKKIEEIASEEFTNIIKTALVDFLLPFVLPAIPRDDILEKLELDISLEIPEFSIFSRDFIMKVTTNLTEVFEVKSDSKLFKARKITEIGISNISVGDSEISCAWRITLNLKDIVTVGTTNISKPSDWIDINYF